MGFFDKMKRLEDEDDDEKGSELKSVKPAIPDPAAKAKAGPPPPPPADPPSAAAKTAPPAPAAPIPAPAAAAPPPPPADPFGIDDAVMLMRQLPSRNIDLVMQVVKKTLESVKVDVVRIIDGATKKEHVIDERIGVLRKEIEKLETQIAAAKKEIAQLDADWKEVTTVKERLILAQKTEAPSDPPRAEVKPGMDAGAIDKAERPPIAAKPAPAVSATPAQAPDKPASVMPPPPPPAKS